MTFTAAPALLASDVPSAPLLSADIAAHRSREGFLSRDALLQVAPSQFLDALALLMNMATSNNARAPDNGGTGH